LGLGCWAIPCFSPKPLVIFAQKLERNGSWKGIFVCWHLGPSYLADRSTGSSRLGDRGQGRIIEQTERNGGLREVAGNFGLQLLDLRPVAVDARVDRPHLGHVAVAVCSVRRSLRLFQLELKVAHPFLRRGVGGKRGRSLPFGGGSRLYRRKTRRKLPIIDGLVQLIYSKFLVLRGDGGSGFRLFQCSIVLFRCTINSLR
jgi:hypothetical protein